MIGVELESDDDEVIGTICVKPYDKERSVLVVSEKGFGKRTLIDDPETGEAVYRVTNRRGKGVKTLNITEKTGNLIAIKDVTDADHLMIINKSGITIRIATKDIRLAGRATQGVTLIKLKENDEIAAVAKITDGENLENEENKEEFEGDTANNSENPNTES